MNEMREGGVEGWRLGEEGGEGGEEEKQEGE